MCKFNTMITIANLWGWPLFLQSQKFTLLDAVIYHQLILSFWKKQLLYYSSASQTLAGFGAHLLKLEHAFNRPVYFNEICMRCGPIVTTDLHS